MPTPSPGLKRVPRWRTMISPPVTDWPANTLTPRRLAFESRPLREEPRPFLCATRSLLGLAERDGGDLDPGEILAVTGAALVSALGLELDHAQLGAALLGHHARRDGHAPDVTAVDDVRAVDVEQRLELHRGALVGGQPLDEQGLTLLHAVLLATCLDDCVHGLLRR